MSWYKVSFSTNQVVSGEHERLQNKFEALFMAMAAPKDMALFSALFHARGEDKMLDIYFSPGAIDYSNSLIREYSGTPCEKPSRDRLAFLVGHADAIERLI